MIAIGQANLAEREVQLRESSIGLDSLPSHYPAIDRAITQRIDRKSDRVVELGHELQRQKQLSSALVDERKSIQQHVAVLVAQLRDARRGLQDSLASAPMQSRAVDGLLVALEGLSSTFDAQDSRTDEALEALTVEIIK